MGWLRVTKKLDSENFVILENLEKRKNWEISKQEEEEVSKIHAEAFLIHQELDDYLRKKSGSETSTEKAKKTVHTWGYQENGKWALPRLEEISNE